ncbi:MAG: thioredoxin family protein [Acidobacteria bacterium]|nr:thioredoxin family protein [Acidobacteriota bacterium]
MSRAPDAPLAEPAHSPSAGRPATSGLARIRGWAGRHERWIWVVAFALLLAWRWPLLKGYYYKFADVAAPPSAIEWRTDFDAALAEARRDGKRVLVDFTADWCPPCIAMKHDVWPDPRVARAIAEGYVPLLIDTDRNAVIPERYGVTGIPTILILDGSGTVLRDASFLSASAMVGFLSGS